MKNFRDAALATALTLGILLGFVCLAVWWMQTNFGAISALATVGSVLGAMFIYVGIRIGGHVQRATMENLVDYSAAVEDTRTAYARVESERARLQREQFVIDAKYRLIEDKRVNQVADQKTRLLMDAERQRWELQQAQQDAARQPAAWAMSEDDAGEGFRIYE